MSPPVGWGNIGTSLGFVNMGRQFEQMITCLFDVSFVLLSGDRGGNELIYVEGGGVSDETLEALFPLWKQSRIFCRLK